MSNNIFFQQNPSVRKSKLAFGCGEKLERFKGKNLKTVSEAFVPLREKCSNMRKYGPEYTPYLLHWKASHHFWDNFTKTGVFLYLFRICQKRYFSDYVRTIAATDYLINQWIIISTQACSFKFFQSNVLTTLVCTL